MMAGRPCIFISYNPKDEAWKEKLVAHLGVLERQENLDVWDESCIPAGQDVRTEIRNAIDKASIAILLISAEYLSTNFFYDKEFWNLLERRQSEGLWIYPLIIKHCRWKDETRLRSMQVRPRGGRPVSDRSESEIDAVLKDVAGEIRVLLFDGDVPSGVPSENRATAPTQMPTEQDRKGDAEIEALARVKIAQINAIKWIVCVSIAVAGSVWVSYMGLKAVAGLVIVVGAVLLYSGKRVRTVAGVGGRLPSGFVWKPVLVSSFTSVTLFVIISSLKHDHELESQATITEATPVDPAWAPYFEPVGGQEGVALGSGDAGDAEQNSSYRINKATGTDRAPPKLRVGNTVVSGELPEQTVLRVVEVKHSSFRGCYEKSTAQNHGLGGMMLVKFVIDRSGFVHGAEATDVGSLADDVVDCIVKNIAQLEFPPPPRGPVTVTGVKIELAPNPRVPPIILDRDTGRLIRVDAGVRAK